MQNQNFSLSPLLLQPWSVEEHKRFLEILPRSSQNVGQAELKSISAYVGTNRSITDVYLHLQKYLDSLELLMKDPDPLGKPWSQEENKAFELLCAEHVEDHESDKFHKIMGKMSGRTVEQLARHYQKMSVDIMVRNSS